MTRDNYLAGSLLVQMLVNYRNFLKKNIWCAQHLDFWEFQSNYVNFPCPRGLCIVFFLAVSFPWSPGVTFQCFFTCKSPTPIYWINVTTIDEYRFSLASVFSNWGIFFFFLKCLTLMAKFEFFGMLTIFEKFKIVATWPVKIVFQMTGNFNVPGARMPQEVEAGETKFCRKMIFQIHSFFFLCCSRFMERPGDHCQSADKSVDEEKRTKLVPCTLLRRVSWRNSSTSRRFLCCRSIY